MKPIVIGKIIEGERTGENVTIDLEELIRSRSFLNANSGGGKSWALRKLLETTADLIQQIIFDFEGEFSTLREKYDYVLIGKGGDINIELKYAEQIALTVLKLNVSVIIDLYELKVHERKLFVKRFLDAMINAPKDLWHPCFVVVDEAQIVCPEKEKSESASSVIDLMTRGRKRGFGGQLATQRIAKVAKDALAEANTQFQGRCGGQEKIE